MTQAIAHRSDPVDHRSRICHKLFTNKFVLFKGRTIPLELEEAYGKILNVMTRLKSLKGHNFLDRAADSGEFWVSPTEVIPFKGQYREESRAVTCFKNEELYNNPLLHSLLQFTISVLPTCHANGCYVNVMFSKHDHSVSALRPHQDNFGMRFDQNYSRFVALYTIMRSPDGIQGGEMVIHKEGVCVAKELNDEPLSGYIVDDDDCMHGASAIEIDQDSGATRNIVVFRIRRNAQPV